MKRGAGLPAEFADYLDIDNGYPEGDGGSGPLTALTADSAGLPYAARFPVGAMPVACRRLVEEAGAAFSCPPEFVAVPMLPTIGAAIGNSRVIKLKEGWSEGPTINAMVVGDPGVKKSPAGAVATRPAVEAQAALRAEFARAKAEYLVKLRAHEAEKKAASKAGEPAPPPPEMPVLVRTVVEDITTEALACVLQQNLRGLLSARDELTAWIKSMDQYRQGGRGADRQFWLSIWGNSYVSVDRKNLAEPLMILRPLVNVYGSIQPGVLKDIVGGRADGMLDRFLVARPDPVTSRWTDAEISKEAREGYADLYCRLRDIDMPTDEHGNPEPAPVDFTPEAKDVMVDAIDAHREEMEQPGFPARLRGPWSKLEAYLARLALILAMARAVCEEQPERIEPPDVVAAVALVDYFKDHARRVYFGLHGEDPLDRLAADLVSFLREHGGSWEGHPSDLHRLLESDHKPKRPDELIKQIKKIARTTPILDVELNERWDREVGNKRRLVRLALHGGKGGKGGGVG